MVVQVLEDYQHRNNVFVDLVLLDFYPNELMDVVQNEIWQYVVYHRNNVAENYVRHLYCLLMMNVIDHLH